jgi:hypothetical protein
MGMVFLPYLSEVVVQRIFLFMTRGSLVYYHYAIFPMLIFNFLVVWFGYQAIELLFPTQTIQMIRTWLRRHLSPPRKTSDWLLISV